MKKIIAVLLGIMMLSVPVFADTTPSDWARNEIDNALPSMFESMGIEVDYQREITRAEFCMLAVNAYKVLSGGLPQIEVEQRFKDVGGETVDMFIPIACSLGIVNGVSETEFAPRAGLTRQELCTMLCRAFAKTDAEAQIKFELTKDSADKFDDSAYIADWARTYVAYCVNQGIIVGTSGTEVSPLGAVSVEQAMVICSRVISEK